MKEEDIAEGFWVFVSHSTKDFEQVRLVRNALEDSGFRPILFYLKCLENETEVNDLLKREIDARKRFILCDSPNAQASKFVQSEVDYIQSKKRMYEIIDLSKIDIESHDADKDVMELIKPFRVRTNVFFCNGNKDHNLARLVETHLALQGFKVTDISCFEDQSMYRHFDGLKGWTDAIHEAISSTLKNGYFLYLIGDSESYLVYEELQYAFEFAPNMVFPVLVNNQTTKSIPPSLLDRNIINVSGISSDEKKAKAIVERLISFDLENQNFSKE